MVSVAASEVTALALFREGPFRLLFTIRFCSSTANQMLAVVVGWQIYDLTASALDLGMIGLVQFLPPLLLTLFAGVAAFGVATIAFGVSENAVLSVFCMLALGAGDMLGQVLRQTVIQLRTPDEMRGRVAALSGLSVNIGSQLGMFESGVTAVWFGTVGSVLFGGFAVVLVVAVWMWRFPMIRRTEHPEE